MATTDPATLSLLSGKTFRVVFTLMTPAPNPQPVDLSLYGAQFAIYAKPGGTALLKVTDRSAPDADGQACVVVQPGGNVGQVAVRLGADQTAAITKAAVYDASIYLQSDPTEVQLLAAGPLTVVLPGADPAEAGQ